MPVNKYGIMSLAIDSQEPSGTAHNSITSPLGWVFDNTHGTLLLAGVVINGSGASTATINSVSYGGTALTAVPGTPITYGNSQTELALYYLENPATGSNTLSVSWNDTSGSKDALGAAISFTGNRASNPRRHCGHCDQYVGQLDHGDGKRHRHNERQLRRERRCDGNRIHRRSLANGDLRRAERFQ